MKINQCIVLAFAAINLCGCVTTKAVYGPDGKEAHAITCSDIGIDWSDCFAKAGEICGTRGYKVWNQAASPSAVIAGSESSVFGSASESRTLLISCKAEQHAAQDPAELPSVASDQ